MASRLNDDYIGTIGRLLVPASQRDVLVVDLFAGCGGLALGFEAQGFETIGFEIDEDCYSTYNKNMGGRCERTLVDITTEIPLATVVIGGPPCQPFSVGGRQHGARDTRDGFPAFIAVVRRLNPDIWLFENVRGMFYRNRAYLERMMQELRSFGYVVSVKLLNAVHYGVPQQRERVFVVGHRGVFSFPSPLGSFVTAGDALGEIHTHAHKGAKFLTPEMDIYVAKYEKASACRNPRDLNLARPSRTVTCRNLAGATGDMMRIRMSDGRRRRLTVREGARLQSFPDWFEFTGSEQSQFKQVGNAVPPMLSYCLAKSVRDYLDSDYRLSRSEIEEVNRGQTAPRQLSLSGSPPVVSQTQAIQ